MVTLTVDQAVEILDILGCRDDTIVYSKQETSVGDLTYTVYSNEIASKIRIRYYGCSGKGLKQGTLQSMVKDRLGV